MKLNHYYMQRAQAAYAAAEAASDSRDKAAWKAAAHTWERLAKPVTQPTYSMEPYSLQLAALKQVEEARTHGPTIQPTYFTRKPVAIIEF